MDIEIDNGLAEVIEELTEAGELVQGSPAYGIAQLYLHQGEEVFSDKQRFVFKKEVSPLLEKMVCTICGNWAPYGGRNRWCPDHRSMMEKANRDD